MPDTWRKAATDAASAAKVAAQQGRIIEPQKPWGPAGDARVYEIVAEVLEAFARSNP